MEKKKSPPIIALCLAGSTIAFILLAIAAGRGSILPLYPIIAALLTAFLALRIYARAIAPEQKKDEAADFSTKHLRYVMPDPATAELILNKILVDFDEEGFFVSKVDSPGALNPVYQIKKNEALITLWSSPKELIFECPVLDAPSIKTAFYEALAEIEEIKQFIPAAGPGQKPIGDSSAAEVKKYVRLSFFIRPTAVEVALKGKNKSEIIEEMVDVLIRSGQLHPAKKDQALKDLWERENTMSTGMQDGVALPHTKTGSVNYMVSAVGIKKTGVDFNSLDGKHSTIFVMTLSSKTHHEPYLQFIAEINKFLIDPENRKKALACQTNKDLYKLLTSAF